MDPQMVQDDNGLQFRLTNSPNQKVERNGQALVLNFVTAHLDQAFVPKARLCGFHELVNQLVVRLNDITQGCSIARSL